MAEHQYGRPYLTGEPGAPKKGDVVVAMAAATGSGWYWIGRVTAVSGAWWFVEAMSSDSTRVVDDGVTAVRWPTEAELTAYQLDPDSARTQRLVG